MYFKINEKNEIVAPLITFNNLTKFKLTNYISNGDI
jgi:hypothetical protein